MVHRRRLRRRHRRHPFATYFMYIVHLISIDLQSSRSLNSPTLHCYSYEPGSHYLLSNQSTCCTINLLPRSRSHYFSYPCSVSSFFRVPLLYSWLSSFTKRTDDRTLIKSNIEHRTSNTSNIDRTEPDRPYDPRPCDRRTNWRIKSKFGTSK